MPLKERKNKFLFICCVAYTTAPQPLTIVCSPSDCFIFFLLSERILRCAINRFISITIGAQSCVRATIGGIADLRCTASAWTQWSWRRSMAGGRGQRQSANQKSASAMREDPHAGEHRIRSTILRNDILKRILQWRTLCSLKTWHRPFKCNFWDLLEQLRYVQFGKS